MGGVCWQLRAVLLLVLSFGTAEAQRIVLSEGEVRWSSRPTAHPSRKLTIYFEPTDTSLTIHFVSSGSDEVRMTFEGSSLHTWREYVHKFLKWHDVVMTEEVTVSKHIGIVHFRNVSWCCYGGEWDW